jgi:hypothetical protein
MPLRSIESFERRWARIRKLASAQLRDFERDKKEIARQIKRYRVKKDLVRLRDAIAHSRRVERVIRGTRQFVKTKNSVVRQARRRGRLLKRALT